MSSIYSRQHTTASHRRTLIALAAALFAAACGSDSKPLPFEPSPGCPFTICTNDGLIPQLVTEPLDDAISRLVPNLGDANTRQDLESSLTRLRIAFRHSKAVDARVELARTLVHLERAEFAGGPDLPDLAAIRLSLVLSAGALGVSPL